MKAVRIAVLTLALSLFAAPTLVFAAPAVDALVLAVWGPDGYFYPARVAAVSGKDVKVAYYDGDVATVPADKTKALDWAVGTAVECNWKNKGKYFPGKIAKKVGEALSIAYADGDAEELGIGRCRSK